MSQRRDRFSVQVVVLYTVILISINNLTIVRDNSNLWTALLSSSLGYLLPSPTLKNHGDFYLTLPSNASMKVHHDNTLARYITDLPQRISLSDEWECRLAEIQYPHTWCNVRQEDTWFFLNEVDTVGLTQSTKIDAGYYHGPVILMDHINKVLRRMWTGKVRAEVSYSTFLKKLCCTCHRAPSSPCLTRVRWEPF